MSALFKKLNLSTQKTIHVLNAPPTFEAELDALTATNGVRVLRKASKACDFALAFVKTSADVEHASQQLAGACQADAVLWMAYPKASSKRYACEFNRDTGWAALGAAGFEPVRQVAIDEDWSALRFRRVEYIKKITRSEDMALSVEGKRRAVKKPGA